MDHVPENIRVMDAHGDHLIAMQDYQRTQKMGGWAKLLRPFGRLLRWNRLPTTFQQSAPTRFLNRFAALTSGQEIPGGGSEFFYEAGLAFTVGENCVDVSEDDGMDYIGGYMPAILLTDTIDAANHFLICGTSVPADDCEDPYCREVRVTVNGAAAGTGDTDGLTHSVAALVHQASRPHPLRAGEVIFSGAAAGCSTAASGILLQTGSSIEVEIAGLGRSTAQLS